MESEMGDHTVGTRSNTMNERNNAYMGGGGGSPIMNNGQHYSIQNNVHFRNGHERFGQILSNSAANDDNVQFTVTRPITRGRHMTTPSPSVQVGDLGYGFLTEEQGSGGAVWFPNSEVFQISGDYNGGDNVVDVVSNNVQLNNGAGVFSGHLLASDFSVGQYDRLPPPPPQQPPPQQPHDLNPTFFSTFPDLQVEGSRMLRRAYPNEEQMNPGDGATSSNQWMVAIQSGEMPLSNGPSVDQYSQEETSESTPKSGSAQASRSRPDIVKDERYWMRRKKNNAAAKRSRDNRRQKENATAEKAKRQEMEIAELRRTNAELQQRLAGVKQDFHRCPRCGYIGH